MMPGKNGDWSQNMWYSWDIATAHFIAYSTEVYRYNDGTIEQQYAWLENDLMQANKNRLGLGLGLGSLFFFSTFLCCCPC